LGDPAAKAATHSRHVPLERLGPRRDRMVGAVVTDLSTAEQRARAARRGPPKDPDTKRVDGNVVPIIGDEERVDPTREELAARREAWEGERRAMTDSQRAARRALPLVKRLEAVQSRTARLSNLRARPIMAAPATTEDGPGGRCPPGQSDNDFARYITVTEAAVEAWEHALDVEEGIAPGRSAALMSTSEKDRELFLTFAGVPAEEVAKVRPEQGSRATVYRRRKLAGFTSLGLDPDTDHAPDAASVNEAVVRLNRPLGRAV
jgi:hypothetical protein